MVFPLYFTVVKTQKVNRSAAYIQQLDTDR